MCSYDEMTHAELIEVIRSLEMAQSASAAGVTKFDQTYPLNAEDVRFFIPNLINLDAMPSEDSSVLKWIYDPHTFSCLAVNEAALAYFSYSRAEFMSLKLINSFPPGVLPLGQKTAPGDFVNLAISGIWQYYGKNGRVGFLHVFSLDIMCDSRPYLLITAYDVSKQYHSEFELKREREWMNRSQVYASFGIWDWDTQSGITHLSEHISALFGCKNKSFQATREYFQRAIHPDDSQRVRDVIQAYCDYQLDND